MQNSLWIKVMGVLLVTAGVSSARDKHVEVTPFTGYQWGGECEDEFTGVGLKLAEASNYGLIVDVDIAPPTQQLELFWSHQATELNVKGGGSLGDMDVDYFHIGGTQQWPRGKVIPFVAGGLGVTYFDPSLAGAGSATRFSMGLGGGVKVMATERIGLRLEARGLATLGDSEGFVFSGHDGTVVVFTRDVFWQFMVSAGVIVRF